MFVYYYACGAKDTTTFHSVELVLSVKLAVHR